MKTVATVLLTLAAFGLVCAEPAPSPTIEGDYDLKQLYEEVRQIVRRHYPQATMHRLGSKIHFEHDTRIFIVHEPLKTGEWQDPWEVRGPKKDGIYGEIEVRQGRWRGAAVVPQTFDKRYFKDMLMAPYSDGLDAHIEVHIKYPSKVPDGFLNELTGVLNRFEQYVAKDAG